MRSFFLSAPFGCQTGECLVAHLSGTNLIFFIERGKNSLAPILSVQKTTFRFTLVIPCAKSRSPHNPNDCSCCHWLSWRLSCDWISCSSSLICCSTVSNLSEISCGLSLFSRPTSTTVMVSCSSFFNVSIILPFSTEYSILHRIQDGQNTHVVAEVIQLQLGLFPWLFGPNAWLIKRWFDCIPDYPDDKEYMPDMSSPNCSVSQTVNNNDKDCCQPCHPQNHQDPQNMMKYPGHRFKLRMIFPIY